MTEKSKGVTNALKIIGFSLYFLILFVERTLALILSVRRGDAYALTSGNVFNFIAYPITALSLAAGAVLFGRVFIGLGKALAAKETYLFDDHAHEWAFASAALLFGGMMHTGFTLAGVQFAAYGFLISAMAVRCAESCLSGEEKYLPVVSLLYLTLFSMSIPVCYISFMEMALRGLFFAAEYAAVFLLVPSFGLMLSRLMKTGRTSFALCIPVTMAVLSGATVALQWQEKINWFVLIFASATAIFYLAFGIVARRKINQQG